MFGGIKAFQGPAAAALEQDLRKGSFPQAVLFSGPASSLRMTTAWETIRILSCGKEGDDQCTCASCRKIRRLDTDQVVVLSRRDHDAILHSYVSLWSRLGTSLSRDLLVANTRVFLLGFHPVLKDTATTKDLKAGFAAAGALSDLLLELKDDRMTETGRKKFAKAYEDALGKALAGQRKDTSLSVDQVRCLADWAAQTQTGGAKQFVILENVEDANASARNSLLKILEEPPEGVYFFLLSQHPERLLATILSRVRRYRFRPLTVPEVHALQQPFYLPAPVDSWQAFFLAGKGNDPHAIADLADSLASRSLAGEAVTSEQLADLLGAVNGDSALTYFLTELSESFERRYLSGTCGAAKARRAERLVSRAASNAEAYNQDRRLLLQGLCLALREVHG